MIHRKKGFTLIEVMLYVSISGMVLFVIFLYMSLVVNSNVKNQVVREVEEQGDQAMRQVLQLIRDSEFANNPTIGNSSTFLSLEVVDLIKDPTLVELSGNNLSIKEGLDSYVSLTNNKVVVSNLNFENLGRTDTNGSLRISFTITHINLGNRQEYIYEKVFTSTASLRQ